MQVEKAIETFVSNYTGSTFRAYQTDLQQWLSYCTANNIEPLQAQPGQIVSWMVDLDKRLGLAQTTVMRKFQSLKALYKWLVEKGMLANLPFNDIPISAAKYIQPRKDELAERREMFRRAAELTSDVQFRALFSLLSNPEVSLLDIERLTPEDVVSETDEINVIRLGSIQSVNVRPDTTEALVQWLAKRDAHPSIKSLFLSSLGFKFSRRRGTKAINEELKRLITLPDAKEAN